MSSPGAWSAGLLDPSHCEYIGVECYKDRGYIKAIRFDGGPHREIHYGWTNGFRSEVEVRSAAGAGANCWESGRASGMWGVSHPVNNIGRGRGPAIPDRDYGTCPKHHLKLPVSGIFHQCSCSRGDPNRAPQNPAASSIRTRT